MSVSNQQIDSAVPMDGEALIEALQLACNGRILPHIEQLNEETDIERFLEMMAPPPFAEMARQSCRAVSGVVIKAMQGISRRAGNGGWNLPSCSVTRDEVMTALAPCLSDFEPALDRYSREYDRYKSFLAETKRGLFGRAFEAGYEGAEIGGRLFGPFGALAGALVNGLCSGKAAEKAVEAAGERLHHAFQQMVEAWDAAMAALRDDALAIIGGYEDQVSAGGG